MRAILRHPRALGVAEMMNFPGVIAGDPDVLARMVAPHVDGHAPGVTGRALDAYVAAGISTDHEAFTAEEALEKRRARDVGADPRGLQRPQPARRCWRMVREHGPDYCAFCTDDREPDFLYREGHIDQMCRIAVAEGVARRGRARDGLAARRAGAQAARSRGDRARLRRRPRAARRPRVASPSSLVLKDGREPAYPAAPPAALRDTMRSVPVSFEIAGAPERVRVIGIQPGQLITDALVEAPRSSTGTWSPTRRATWRRSR